MPDTAPTISAIIDDLRSELAERLPLLTDVAADIHAHPETRYEEFYATARLTRELDEAGFAVERDYAGIPTAFVARWSTPDATPTTPTIAIFCEYDALEGIGHACGHNIIAAAGLGSSLVVKDVLERAGQPEAHLVVIGSPAEEGAAGKVPMIEHGVLEGVDLAIMVHPSGFNAVDGDFLSRVALDVEFTGRATHAAASPHLGINALDAATLSLTAIGLLRQQLAGDVRVHAIITDGGQAANIIPEFAAVRAFVRAQDLDTLLGDVVPRVKNCFEGAALATGTSVLIEERTPAYYPVISNPVLASLATDAFEALGRDVQIGATSGSTDMGNVSHVVPSLHPMIMLERDGVTHTREFAAAAGGPLAAPTISDGAALLASMALAAFRDPSIVTEAKAAFDAR